MATTAWPYWCATTGTTGTALISSSSATWANWNAAVTNVTTALSTTATAWANWNQQFTSSPLTITIPAGTWELWNAALPSGVSIVGTRAPETAEQRAARQQREREQAAARLAREATRTRARERALGLLMSFLDDEQQRSYREDGFFDVTGSKGRRWRIQARSQAGNVLLLPDAPEVAEADSFCCHPPGALPDADAHLAQMLHLVTDEEDFVRTANPAGRRALRSVA
jgi:hypothetical protein